MGTQLRVLSKSYPMNTNMIGFRWFSKIFASILVLVINNDMLVGFTDWKSGFIFYYFTIEISIGSLLQYYFDNFWRYEVL